MVASLLPVYCAATETGLNFQVGRPDTCLSTISASICMLGAVRNKILSELVTNYCYEL